MTQTQPIVLSHGDTVRLATWAYPYNRSVAFVGTTRGYTDGISKVTTAQQFHDAALARGHATCWTTNPGSALVAGKAANEAMRAKEDADLARSIVLAPGDVVSIEGELFTVRVNAGNLTKLSNSDPIAFRR